jgi:hypothetical protein
METEFSSSFPPFSFPKQVFCVCYTSQCPVHFSKERCWWCRWNVNALQAVVRNFLLINNFATWFLVLQRFLFFHFFSLEQIWNSVPKQKRLLKNICSTWDKVTNLFIVILVYYGFQVRKGGEPVRLSRCYDNIPFYRSCSRGWRQFCI